MQLMVRETFQKRHVESIDKCRAKQRELHIALGNACSAATSTRFDKFATAFAGVQVWTADVLNIEMQTLSTELSLACPSNCS